MAIARSSSPLERRTEGDIATLDGIPRIAQQMRQAHLPLHSMAALAAEHIGDPGQWRNGTEQVGHDDLAAAGANDVQHRQGVDKHPFPPGLATHACRGFIGAGHRACRHRLADHRRRGLRWLTRTGQHVVDRTFADGQGKQLAHQGGQPFQPDHVGVMQIHRYCRDRLAERRTRFQRARRSGGCTLAAACAAATEQPPPCHIGLDRWQLDAVVHLLWCLPFGGEGGGAMRAAIEPGIHGTVGVRLQRTPEAATALARWLIAGGTIGLRALRTWQG